MSQSYGAGFHTTAFLSAGLDAHDFANALIREQTRQGDTGGDRGMPKLLLRHTTVDLVLGGGKTLERLRA